MQVTVNVDCTPEEARRLMGLPDLTPVHDAYIEKMKKVIDEGLTPDSIEAMMRSWNPMGEAGMNLWRNMFDQISNAGGASK